MSEPRALKVVSGEPVMNGKLELIRGPERIDAGWWDRPGDARDYYIGRHGTGTLYWVFCHVRTGRWFAHGVFS